nr:calcium-transporting ATPase 5, plasma membrane-type-like isoform X4 [Lolium perenne]
MLLGDSDTLDLKKEEEKEHIRRKIRAHAQVIRAALLFKEAGEKQNGDRELQARSFINKAWRIRLAMDMAAIVNRSLASMHRAYFSASG